MNRFEFITRFVGGTPWAIMPEVLDMIKAIITFRAAGDRLTLDEIREQIGAKSLASHLAQPMAARAVAVLPLRGIIAHRAAAVHDVSIQAGTSTELFRKSFTDALEEDAVGSILIDVDSPGGTVDDVPDLADLILASRGQKPIVAVVNTLAASAAYWIASAADEVVITKSGEVGSIGVYTVHEDLSQYYEKKGLKTTLISAGEFKVEGNPFEPLGDEARAHLQSRVDAFSNMFVEDVARGRGITVAQVHDSFGQGRIFGGKEAKSRGMVDRIATFREVMAGLLEGPAEARRGRQRAERHRHDFSFGSGAR